MNVQREKRKLEHVQQALQTKSGPLAAGWEDLHLVHQALLRGNLNEVDLSLKLFSKKLQLPLFINAMTGGAQGLTDINRVLAETAREYGIGMAVGSQTAGIDNQSLANTYKIARAVNPDGLLFANVGAGVKPEIALAAVEMLEADALQLHLNGVQELTMAEGDRTFAGIAENIAAICQRVPVPVIVKEVGNGISREVAVQLAQIGVQGLDTGGSGGTNFVAIELQRVPREHLDFLRSWGLTSATSLLEVIESVSNTNVSNTGQMYIFASGGITTSQHIIKVLAIGADAVGMAGNLLQILQRHGVSALKKYLANLTEELKIMMLLIGAQSLVDLRNKPVVITGFTREWCEERGINTKKYAQRN